VPILEQILQLSFDGVSADVNLLSPTTDSVSVLTLAQKLPSQATFAYLKTRPPGTQLTVLVPLGTPHYLGTVQMLEEQKASFLTSLPYHTVFPQTDPSEKHWPVHAWTITTPAVTNSAATLSHLPTFIPLATVYSGLLAGAKVSILGDTGASHNFGTLRMAQSMGLTITSCPLPSVSLAGSPHRQSFQLRS